MFVKQGQLRQALQVYNLLLPGKFLDGNSLHVLWCILFWMFTLCDHILYMQLLPWIQEVGKIEDEKRI